MKRLILCAARTTVATVLALYLLDTVILHLRATPYRTVTVQHYFVIKQKNNRYQVQYDRSIDQPCANSLFPHSGKPPCWYILGQGEQRTEI